MIPQGLKPLSLEDHAQNYNYRVGALMSLSLADVPARWRADYPTGWVFNQGIAEPTNDECGGCALAMSIAIREGEQIDPHFHWMMARQADGESLTDYGTSNRALADTSRKIGSLLTKDSPFSFASGRDTIADPTKWDIANLKPKAANQISGSVVWVKKQNGLDTFDAFRASIWQLNKLYNRPHTAIFGLIWGYDLANPHIDHPVEDGSGHDTLLIGWDGDYAIMLNSYGNSTGSGAEYRVHRSVINRWGEEFGMPILIDATQEQIKQAVAQGSKLDDPWFKNLFRVWVLKMRELIDQIKRQTGNIPSPLLLPALIWQESEGLDNAIGDAGHAFGPLQIWQSYIDDALPGHKASECLNNRPLSIDVFNRYMARYATSKQLGRPVTDQDIARIHNGGPRGYRNPKTLIYWQQVSKKLSQLQNKTAPQWILDRLKGLV